MSDSAKKKSNKSAETIKPDVLAIFFVIAVIVVYVFCECYSATHVDVETVTAVKSTVYENIDAKALVIRDERLIEDNSDDVKVACVLDGEKVAVKGNIAMTFKSEEDAGMYVKLQELHQELDHYLELQNSSAGLTTDVSSIDKEILNNVNGYIQNANSGDVQSLSGYAEDINDKLIRRQLIIGEKIDFASNVQKLQSQISEISQTDCSPIGYITTDESGIFSSYTDGLESAFKYDDVLNIDVKSLNSYIEKASKQEQSTESLGKLVTKFKWYFCCVVSADDVDNIKNGDTLEVALKDSNKTLKCTVESGAEVDLGVDETVLVLSCSEMDGAITSMRIEDIEIRYNSYSGYKVPASAVHVDDEGKKCVYALIANKVAKRQGEIIYSTKDYVVFSDDDEQNNAIRMYDQIITKGKNLYDGKVYS